VCVCGWVHMHAHGQWCVDAYAHTSCIFFYISGSKWF